MKDDVISNLLPIFREEAGELLDRLADAFSRLPQAGSPEQVKTIANECMRLAHNLKGAAASVGFEDIARRAHAVEDEIARVAKREAEPSASFIAGLHATTDDLRRMIMESGAPQAVSEKKAAAVPPPPKAVPAPARRAEEKPLAPASAEPPKSAVVPSIRIAADRLDRVMAHAEELFALQSREQSQLVSLRRLLQRAGAVLSSDASERRDPALLREMEEFSRIADTHGGALDRLVADFAEALKTLRMIPISSVVPAWQRAVRDASRVVGKPVRLDVAIGDLELDKAVLDLLQDPVIHLLRNSVDHGIESPEERSRKGKPPLGSILMSGEIRGASVHLVVSDDGRGLDAEALRQAARARQPAEETAVEDMKDHELIDLIFVPGFSTRAEVSSISGRGFGLDVVREALEKLGGKVGVIPHGSLGGASFELEVPLSILSSRGLLVEAGGAIAAIPIDAVERTLEAAVDAVVETERGAIVQREGEDPLRLVWLNDVIGGGRKAPSKNFRIVVVVRGGRRLGLAVDGIRGESEFVTRRLPWNLSRVNGISGAIAQADGTVGLVLDVAEIMEDSGRPRRTGRAGEERSAVAAAARARILVADDSLTARTLHRNTLLAAGYDVTTAADGAEALRLLEKGTFALLVSDVEMPLLDGIGLVRRIRASEKLRTIPVILVSQRSRATDIESGLAAGADDYIIKGVLDQDKLLEAVSRRL